MTDNETTKGSYQVKIYWKVVFGFAENHENAA